MPEYRKHATANNRYRDVGKNRSDGRCVFGPHCSNVHSIFHPKPTACAVSGRLMATAPRGPTACEAGQENTKPFCRKLNCIAT